MGRLMPQPWKHPQTGVYWFRKTVPERLRAAVGKREIKFSLRTKDPREAKLKYPDAAATADFVLQQAAGEPTRLTHKQILALAGEWYRRELKKREDSPGDPLVWEETFSHLCDLRDESLTAEYRREREEHGADAVYSRRSEHLCGDKAFLDEVKADVDRLLASKNLLIDQDSYERLAEDIYDSKIQLCIALARRARGDYRPDSHLAELPSWEELQGKAEETSGTTLTSLVEAWVAERRPPDRTVYEWRRVVHRLKEHLGHEDAERITKKDVVAWKDALMASGKSPKTVKNHVNIINTLYNSGLANERLQRNDNPVKGVRVASRQDPGELRQPYAEEEAVLILRAARGEKGAKRWVPWLLAFTGARLDEVCQALTSDIRREGDTWYLDINAEKGKKLKNIGSARRVPLHPALIEEGFLDYVEALPGGGPLFPDLTPDRFGSRGGSATKKLGRWIRGLGITDPHKAPSHSSRHRFKDLCRGAGIEEAVSDALTGHAPRTVGGRYGRGYPLLVLKDAIEKISVPPELAGEPRETARRAGQAA